MKTDNQELGDKGEEMSAKYLKEKGWEIVGRNCQLGKEEIDIIASNKDTILFVEVKTRSTDKFGEPFRFVNKAKQKRIIKAANAYIVANNVELEARFDIISIILNKYRFEIEHIERAFFPHI